jgi:hypothetical protein
MNSAMEGSIHFADMLREREIKREWVNIVLEQPDRTEDHDDGTRHFIKQIPEFGNRWLHVVVNVAGFPRKTGNCFF